MLPFEISRKKWHTNNHTPEQLEQDLRIPMTDLRSNEGTTTQMEHQEHIAMQTIRPHTYTKMHTDNHTPD